MYDFQVSSLDNYVKKETIIERENTGEEGGLKLSFRLC